MSVSPYIPLIFFSLNTQAQPDEDENMDEVTLTMDGGQGAFMNEFFEQVRAMNVEKNHETSSGVQGKASEMKQWQATWPKTRMQ